MKTSFGLIILLLSDAEVRRFMKKNDSVNAIELLKEDHKTVKKLFKSFEKTSKSEHEEKRIIVEEITGALAIHAMVEEEIFYPAVKKARAQETKDEVLEAYEEHQRIKALLGALKALSPHDEAYDKAPRGLLKAIKTFFVWSRILLSSSGLPRRRHRQGAVGSVSAFTPASQKSLGFQLLLMALRSVGP